MKILIEISCDSPAFKENLYSELHRVLLSYGGIERKVYALIEEMRDHRGSPRGISKYLLRDSLGEGVGWVEVEP